MAQFLLDTFTDTDTTDVTSHVGETGATNSYHSQAGTVLIHGNAAYCPDTTSRVITSGVPANADYTIEAIVDVKLVIPDVVNKGTMICSRMIAGGGLGIAVIFNGAECAVYWDVTLEASVPAVLSVGEHTVTVSVIGTSVKVYFDGVLNQTVVATTPTAKGKVGYGWQTGITTTAGIHIKSIRAYDGDVEVPGGDAPVFIGGGFGSFYGDG